MQHRPKGPTLAYDADGFYAEVMLKDVVGAREPTLEVPVHGRTFRPQAKAPALLVVASNHFDTHVASCV